QHPPRLEAEHEVLPAPFDGRDALALEAARDRRRLERHRQAGVVDPNPLDPPPLEHRRERPPNRLDLGQLRHRDTLSRGRVRRRHGRSRHGTKSHLVAVAVTRYTWDTTPG